MTTSRSKNYNLINDFYFNVYSFVKSNSKLPKGLGSKQKIHYYVKTLTLFGAVFKTDIGTLAILTPQHQS
jgi:hypothetical protein